MGERFGELILFGWQFTKSYEKF